MTQMMPPPLPGYPGAPPAAAPAPFPVPGVYPAPTPAAAPMPAPQGYPGPAVAPPPAAPAPAPYPAYAAPAPAPAPAAYPPGYGAPVPVAAPPQGYPQQAAPPGYPPQGYGAPPAAYPPQAAPGYPPQPQQSQFIPPSAPTDIGAAIAAATGGDRAPTGEPGAYDLEILETLCTVHPIERKLTFKAVFKVLSSSNPSYPQGSEICYLEGLTWESSGKRIQDFLVAGQGYPAKIVYDQTMMAAGIDPKAELTLIGNAAGNSQTQIPGNKYGPNPLKGRRVSAVVARETKIAGPRSKKAGQQVTYTTWKWAPGPA